MVSTIEVIARRAGGGATPTVLSASVLTAMGHTPRHAFVPADLRNAAYDDRPLPIGYGQTISQPYIVALMSDLLRLAPRSRALEIGTGSGYRAAVLAELGHEVYTIEIVPALASQAAKRLSISVTTPPMSASDSYFRMARRGPFDAIVVTAAAPQSRRLCSSSLPGGRMVIPVGAAFLVQQLS
jgi:protein-L-isoaspartate(D-aspartate) O-methyltransferase